MPRERIVLMGLAALLVFGLIFGAIANGVSAGQRDAWMEGYTMGRLTAAAGVDGALAPMAPYAGYGAGYTATRGHGPGFGGFLFMLLGAGALFFFISRLVMRERWRTWAAMQGAPGAAMPGGPAGLHQGPPWTHGPRGCGPWGNPWGSPWEQSQRQAQGQGTAPVQPGQGAQPPQPDSAPAQPDAQR
jgi:hypothetical protein